MSKQRKLHWKTEQIVEKVRQYLIEETGTGLEDFLEEVAEDAEDECKCRYTNWDDEKECWTDWYEVDIDECFDDDDWDDVESHIMYEAENYIDFVKEQKAE